MAIQFMQLPALEANRLLNFAPVSNGIGEVKNALDYREKFDYQKAQDAKQEARASASHGAAMSDRAERRRREQVEMLGKQSLAVQQIQDPARRAMIWGRIVQSHPNAKGLGAEYHDPTTGPELLAAEAGQYVDDFDRKMKEAELGYKQAQTQKLQAEAAGGGGTEYGKTGAIFQDPQTGEYFTVQFGANGQKLVEPVGQNLAPFRGTQPVGDEIINKATGATVRNVAPQLAGAKAAEERGKAQGISAAALPTVLNASQRMLSSIDAVIADPNLEKVTGMIGGRIPKTLQTETMAESQSRVDQLKGQTFLQAYNDLRGAGQITEREGQAAQEAYNRLTTQTMGTEAYKKAAREFRSEVLKLVDIAKLKAGGGQSPATVQPPPGDGFTVEFE